jgi:hypothetical protein
MKIAEIVGSYAKQEASVAPDSSLLQTIANAFTRSGKVKRPLNQQPSDGQPLAGHIPFSSFAASGEDPAADAASNTSTDAPIIPTTQFCVRTAVPRLGPPVRYPEKSSSGSSSF